jgi:hypothetical protein
MKHMSKKEQFMEQFAMKTGTSAKDYKDKPKEFADILNNKHPELKSVFREAVEECSSEDAGAAGLGALFQGMGQ